MNLTKFIATIFLCIVLSLFVFACSRSSVAGKYISEDNTSNYTELKADGTFLAHQGSHDFAGKYEVKGTEITLILNSGQTVRGKIEGKTIINTEGKRWTKH